MAIEMGAAHRFDLEVSPALVAFGELLQLSYQSVESMIDDEVRDNPALERLDPLECPVCRGVWQRSCPVCSAALSGSHRSRGDRDCPSVSSIDIPSARSAAESLLTDVRIELSPGAAPIAEYLIGSLDEHGMLDGSTQQLAGELGVGEAAITEVLSIIRRNGPPGLCATTVSECLMLQLEAISGLDARTRSLTRVVLADHLPALARGHFAAIAAALGVDSCAIQDVLRLVREHLRPYPAFDGSARVPTQRVVPDLVISERIEATGEFTVELVEPSRVRLRLRVPVRPDVESPGDGQARDAVRAARQLLGQLGDRWDTLRRVADFAVGRQRDYLRHGPAALKPLHRNEAAAALGLHESTVSRAVAGKYALLPSRRITPLAAFFSASGGLDEELRELVRSEETPLSDQELADRLRVQGYPVARRTVAKHRARLGIGAAAQR